MKKWSWIVLLLPLLASAKEVTLSYQGVHLVGDLQKAQGGLEKGVVILVHGSLAHSRMELIEQLQQQLKEGGISSLAVNLSLGKSKRHGMYDCASPHRHKHEDVVQELALWESWLRSEGASRFYYIGHSRGGSQVALYALQTGSRQPLALLAPMTFNTDRQQARYQDQYGASLESILADMEKQVQAGKGNELVGHTGFLHCADAQVTPASFVSYYGSAVEKDTPAILAQLSQNVMVYIGTEDDVVPDLAEKMMQLGKDNVHFKLVNGADHFFRDFYLEEVSADLLERIAEAWQ